MLHWCLLNLIASIAGDFHFLIQFIRFYGLLLVDIVSWILLSKKILLDVLTNLLYLIYSVLLLDVQYLAKSLLYSSFHHTLEYLVMVNIFWILIPKLLYNRSKLLSYLFQHFTTIHICYINTTYFIFQFIDEFFFFLTILMSDIVHTEDENS